MSSVCSHLWLALVSVGRGSIQTSNRCYECQSMLTQRLMRFVTSDVKSVSFPTCKIEEAEQPKQVYAVAI